MSVFSVFQNNATNGRQRVFAVLWYDGGIKSFSFDVGHDNATVAVIIIYPHHIQFTRDSVTGVPMVKKSMGRTLYPPYACRV